ncbi:MAG: hypothetical protein FJ333_07870, partial [Sphingomonadales bacterium]|nr:hypothetical protein [Sphingomonadales bacterium]
DAAVFMLQNLPATRSKQKLLAFYDSGCGGAGISDRAYNLLETVTIRKGPTILDVAGGKCVEIPYGDEQLTLELTGKQLATVTALHMPAVTTPFPLVQLAAAWDELAKAATASGIRDLPTSDDTIGGTAVDIIIGIRYLKYYPELVFTLPSGLAIYRAKFKSYSGHQAVLGGPHAAWTIAAEAASHMNPRAYLTSEARAWCVEQAWVRLNQDKFKPVQDGGEDDCCCDGNGDEMKASLFTSATIKKQEDQFWRVEAAGTEISYRCENCRSCQKCKNPDMWEAVSLREEAEQALIKASVELKMEDNAVVAFLPFVEDPAIVLKPNRHIAEQILKSQLNLFKKRPELREDTVRSHEKLVKWSYVKTELELTDEERAAMTATPGEGYFIPWRIVHNEHSLSTPCRLVFDASSRTPGGNSLNGALAKGQNRLNKLQNLLARFRQRPAAFSADISMCYNGTRLRPEHFKFQKYLWKEGLLESEPTIIRYVVTLIYGVKPSGAQSQVAIEKLAGHFLENEEHVDAARSLIEDTYVDDIMSGGDSVQDCYQAAEGIVQILTAGGMRLKPFVFSGQPPSEEVSADGLHVNLGGYLWQPEEDKILLNIGPHRFGKPVRGKLPDPVTGDFGDALSRCFTRRTVAGIVAKVFDPLGLATPITASLKLDLHELCAKKLDWDDPAPPELLPIWAANMETIQRLKFITYPRAFIPPDAATDKVDLLVATDASQNLAAAAVYARVLRKTGEFSCCLVTARSKIVNNLTVPRAELRAAVIGVSAAHIIKCNLGDRCGEILYVTDSTVCLHWIHQDDRPLQVAVRNAVIEIRRLSKPEEWLHIESSLNVADLATRRATIDDIETG